MGGVILRANKEVYKIFGYQSDEIEGCYVEVLIPGNLKRIHKKLRDRFLELPSPRDMGALNQLKAIRKDGSEVPVYISLNPTIIDGMSVIVVSIRDITQLALAEEKVGEAEAEVLLLRSEKMSSLGLSMRNISHDMNNLLNVIKINLELVQEQADSKNPFSEQLNDIVSVTSELILLTQKISIYSTEDKDKVGMHDISLLLKGMAAFVKASINNQAKNLLYLQILTNHNMAEE